MKKLIPAFLVFFCICNSYATWGQTTPITSIQKIVIDAGHGGRDPGAISPDGKHYEKTINLAVAKYLGAEINKKYPQIEVIYTRTSDKAVGLDRRGTLATESHADLFISIHVNSAKKPYSGYLGPETWVFGGDRSHRKDSSYIVVTNENEAIKFEEDYSIKYEGFDSDNPQYNKIVLDFQIDAIMKQSRFLGSCVQQALHEGPYPASTKDRGMKEGGLMVLAYCSMPAILVEIGFLNSAADRRILTTDSGRRKLGHQLFLGFETYKKQHEANLAAALAGVSENASQNTFAPADPLPVRPDTTSQQLTKKQPTVIQPSAKRYRVQILSNTKPIASTAKDFKGYKNVLCLDVPDQRFRYKYTLGDFEHLKEAQQYCQKLRAGDFPGAFVIAVQDEKLVPTN